MRGKYTYVYQNNMCKVSIDDVTYITFHSFFVRSSRAVVLHRFCVAHVMYLFVACCLFLTMAVGVDTDVHRILDSEIKTKLKGSSKLKLKSMFSGKKIIF